MTVHGCLQVELLGFFLGRGKRILDLENTLEMNFSSREIPHISSTFKKNTVELIDDCSELPVGSVIDRFLEG